MKTSDIFSCFKLWHTYVSPVGSIYTYSELVLVVQVVLMYRCGMPLSFSIPVSIALKYLHAYPASSFSSLIVDTFIFWQSECEDRILIVSSEMGNAYLRLILVATMPASQ